ncbi:MAG: enoyl-CoA hydratase-related protein, partial [Defluviicoccus sp.]|nr:enoyl-CoA hydratase-related protein [Defluviicoccus sp.]
MSLILTEFKDGVGTLTMNDPAKRNALSRALTADAAAALAIFREQGARAVIIRAARGTKVWSAGYDITELGDVEVDALGSSDGIRTLVRAVEAFPAPVIALLEGGVFGAACELAMVSDLIVAAPNVSFTITPAKLGLVYNVS